MYIEMKETFLELPSEIQFSEAAYNDPLKSCSGHNEWRSQT